MPFLLLDIEGIIDHQRLLKVEKPERHYTKDCDLKAPVWEPETETVAREIDRICKADPGVIAGTKACFVPARYHAPVAICILLIGDDMSYIGHWTIANEKPAEAPSLPMVPDIYKNVKAFWDGFQWACANHGPLTVVTFGGGNYDMPVLEANAMELGIPIPGWMVFNAPSYKDPRMLAGREFHLDLSSFLGQGRGGTLSFWSRLVGLPGKLDSNGAMVAQMLAKAGGLSQVVDYCWCDVLNLYGLFFATRFTGGAIPASFKKNPIFENTMTKCFTGLGPETNRFVNEYNSTPGVPF